MISSTELVYWIYKIPIGFLIGIQHCKKIDFCRKTFENQNSVEFQRPLIHFTVINVDYKHTIFF